MAVKLGKLKADKIRATIQVVVDGHLDKITVFNPTPEQRIYFHDKLDEKLNQVLTKDGKLIMSAEEVLRIFYLELTDLEIDDEDSILDVIANPSKEILMVAQHINQIVHELVMELMINKKLELNKILEVKEQGEMIQATRGILDALGIKEEDLDAMGSDEPVFEIVGDK